MCLVTKTLFKTKMDIFYPQSLNAFDDNPIKVFIMKKGKVKKIFDLPMTVDGDCDLVLEARDLDLDRCRCLCRLLSGDRDLDLRELALDSRDLDLRELALDSRDLDLRELALDSRDLDLFRFL